MTITLTRKEAQQVLDLMTRYRTETPLGHQPHMISHKADDAIEILRARLSAPEPEPYGYIARRNWKMPVFIEADNVEAAGLPYNNADYEPVFKAPPQREWQGLTDEECDEIWDECLGVFDCLKMTEAKLKEKNT